MDCPSPSIARHTCRHRQILMRAHNSQFHRAQRRACTDGLACSQNKLRMPPHMARITRRKPPSPCMQPLSSTSRGLPLMRATFGKDTEGRQHLQRLKAIRRMRARNAATTMDGCRVGTLHREGAQTKLDIGGHSQAHAGMHAGSAALQVDGCRACTCAGSVKFIMARHACRQAITEFVPGLYAPC